MKYGGIDPATACGWSVFEGEQYVRSGVYDFKRAVAVHGNVGRFIALRILLDEEFGDATEVFYEDVKAPKFVGWAYQYGGMIATLQLWGHDNRVPITPVSVGAVKRALSGRGDATKEMQLLAARRKFGVDCQTHDEADAIGVCLAGIYAKTAGACSQASDAGGTSRPVRARNRRVQAKPSGSGSR